MLDSPILWGLLFVIFVAFVVYKMTVQNLEDQTIWIAGIKHALRVDLKGSSYSYDCAGHLVRVYVRDDVVVAEDSKSGIRAATPDEIREWRRLFGIGPILPM